MSPRSSPATFNRRVVTCERKLDLIATGFAEAAVAASDTARFVNLEARVNPGRSTSLTVFKDK